MTNFSEILYNKIKSIISGWNEPDIFAISFFVNSNECYEYNGFSNITTFAVSYNTEEGCNHAGPYDEERWNYAYWEQDETFIIDTYEPDSLIDMLFEWYKENNIQNIGYEDENDHDSEGNYIGKGPVGEYELAMLVADIAKRLQNEGFIKNHFQKTIPIIVHDLEYPWYYIEATKHANPNGEADVFLDAMKKAADSERE